MCPFLARARVRRFSYFAFTSSPNADKPLVHCELRVKASHLPVHPLRSKKHNSTSCNTTDCPIGEGEHSLYVHPQHSQTQSLNGEGEEVKAKIENRLCTHYARVRARQRLHLHPFVDGGRGSARCRHGWELWGESSLFSSHSPPFFRRVSIARLESFDRLQKYLLVLGLILVILCNFVPKSMRMPLRCAVNH